MHKVLHTYGNSFTKVEMVQTAPSQNWLRTHEQGCAFVVPAIQAHDTKWITAPMYSVNHLSPTYLPINLQETSSRSTVNQQKTASHPPVECKHQYFCNCLAQLQGNFWDNGLDGGELQIVLPGNGDKQRAIVRRVRSAGEDRFIYDEEYRFTLCSMDDDVEAVMLKRASSWQSLKWWRNDGKPMLWLRLNKKHKTIDTQTLSRISREFSEQELSGEGVCNRPDVPEPDEDSTNDLTNKIACRETSSYSSAIDQKYSDNELFGIFRTRCKDPLMLQKVLDWGISRTPNLKVGEKEIRELSAGRLWVCVRLSSRSSKYAKNLFGYLDDLKGAYQEDKAGVYYQPLPMLNEPGIQHRLQKLAGYWVIEAFDKERRIWRERTRELPNGNWVDLTSGLTLNSIYVVPMINILNRMKDDWSEYDEMENRIDFLFNTCNQHKLHTKLRPRSLKHHIINLRVKLEKQCALSFAVNVAKTADSISLNRCKVKAV